MGNNTLPSTECSVQFECLAQSNYLVQSNYLAQHRVLVTADGCTSLGICISVVKKLNQDVLCSPVILTGRGGSGTRLLSQLSVDHGLFLGNRLNESGDSMEWVDAIYTLAHQKLSDLTAIANDPNAREPVSREPVSREAVGNATLGKETVAQFRDIAQSVLMEGNWSVGQPWGFKLPECMLVLPELLAAFPDAKVVHQFRHPVSSSLRRTHRTSRSVNPLGKLVLQRAYAAFGREEDHIYSDEPYRRNAYTWRYQVSQVVEFTRNRLPSEKLLELSYETVCQNPASAREKFSALLKSVPKNPCSLTIDPLRCGIEATDSPEAAEVWHLCHSLAKTLGYNETVSMPLAA